MSAAAMPPPPPLPELRQDAVVTLPDQQQYRGRVTRVTDEEIVLVLMLDARGVGGIDTGDVAAMVVEYAGARGLVRLEGQGTVASYDLIRFRLVGAVDVVQRRDFVRVSAVRPLQLALVGDDDTLGEWADALTINVSGNGLLASGGVGIESLEIGDAIAFRVTLVDDEPAVEGRGRVARIGDDGQRGIAIEEIDRESRRHLVRFIFEQERIARQRTRDGEL